MSTSSSLKSALSQDSGSNINSLDQGYKSAEQASALPKREQILHFPLPFLTGKQARDYAYYYNPPKRGRVVFGKYAPFADVNLMIDGNRILGSDDEYIMDKIRNEFRKEQKDIADVEKTVPRMGGKGSDTKLRLNEYLVLRSTPRYITSASKIQSNDPDHAGDPIWLIEQIRGRIPPRDKELLEKNVANLLAGKYKVSNRVSKTIKYSDFFITYAPLEAEMPADTVRLTLNWAVTGPKQFIDEFRKQLDERKNMKAGYSKNESERVYKVLQLISTYKLNDYARKDIDEEMQDDTTNKIQDEIVQLIKSFGIPIPVNAKNEIDVTIVPLYSDDDYLTQAIYIDKYVQMERVLQELKEHGDDGEGTDKYPELINRITTAMNELRKLIKNDQIVTNILPIHYFENFDYESPELTWKMSVYTSWNEAVRLERLRRPPYVDPKRVLEHFGKDTTDLTTFTIENVKVTPRLSQVVRDHLGTLAPLEQEFNAAYGNNIQLYIQKVAQVIANLDAPQFKQRLEDGSLNAINVKNEDVYPQLFLLPEFTDSSVGPRPKKSSSLGSARRRQVEQEEYERAHEDVAESLRSAKSSMGSSRQRQVNEDEFHRAQEDFDISQRRRQNTQNVARFNRWMDDKRNEEANYLLHTWQPSVKKQWFPISAAPNKFKIEDWIDAGKVDKKSSTKSQSLQKPVNRTPVEPLFELIRSKFGEYEWLDTELLKEDKGLDAYIRESAVLISYLYYEPFKQRLEAAGLTSANYDGSQKFRDVIFTKRQDVYKELFTDAVKANVDEMRILNSAIASNSKNIENDILQEWKGTDSAISPVKYWFVDLNNWDNFLNDQVGQTCGEEKIYVLTKDGIKCLSKQEISANLAEYAPYNRADLANLL